MLSPADGGILTSIQRAKHSLVQMAVAGDLSSVPVLPGGFYLSSLNVCLPALRPTYPLPDRTNFTHRSGSSAPGLRHKPSGVGRHFGDNSNGPLFILPVPF